MTDARENSKYGHVFRPGPLRAMRSYWIDSGMLRWRIGGREGRVPVAEIVSMRLWMPAGAPAYCRLVDSSGRAHAITDRHWFGLGRRQQREASFRGLVFTLARRVKAANPQAQFLEGLSRGEWIASWIVAGLLAAVAIAGLVLMVAQGRVAFQGFAPLGLALAFAPTLWPLLRAGPAKPFDPDSLHNKAPAPGWVDWRSP